MISRTNVRNGLTIFLILVIAWHWYLCNCQFRAMDAERKHNYQEAIDLYSNSMMFFFPDIDDQNYYWRADDFYQLGKYDKAVQDYDSELSISHFWKNIPIAYNVIVRRWFLTPDLHVAKIYCRRGRANFALHNYEISIDDFNNSIEHNPSEALSYWYRGKAYDAMGKHELAAKDFALAQQLKPGERFE